MLVKGGRAVGRVWCVDCLDEQGAQVQYIVWDADSGKVLITSVNAKRSRPDCKSMSRRSAIHETGYWLRQLGLAESGMGWKLAGDPEQEQTVWTVTCRTSGRRATIVMDRSTGDLISAVTFGA
jgi:hypothetical protein